MLQISLKILARVGNQSDKLGRDQPHVFIL